MHCSIADTCSGCDWIGKPYDEQTQEKIAFLRRQWEAAGLSADALSSLEVRTVAESGLRDRVDLVLQKGKLGLYEKEKKQIVDIDECPQMTPALLAWVRDFRQELPPVQLGSLRLRVSPSGKRGAWLDFSNADIKRLLDERSYLEALEKKAVVEIGQKRKRIRQKETALGLGEPELEAWFETYLDEVPTALYSTVGAFSQVGFRANRTLVAAFRDLLSGVVTGKWVELGSGIGNFTLPLAYAGAEVVALEIDALASAGATRSAEKARLVDKIQFRNVGFHTASDALVEILKGATGIVADPPRSGLQSFPKALEALPIEERPSVLIYVSCFPESFAADSVKLYELGYRLKKIVGVDQFPQSRHLETLARFERS